MFSRLKKVYAHTYVALSLIGLMGCGNIEQTVSSREICSISDTVSQKEEPAKKKVLPFSLLSSLFLQKRNHLLFFKPYPLRARDINLSAVNFENYFKEISLLNNAEVEKNYAKKAVKFFTGFHSELFEYYRVVANPAYQKDYSFAVVRKLLEEKINRKTHFTSSAFLSEEPFRELCGLRANGCTLEKKISVLDRKNSVEQFVQAEKMLTIAHEESHTLTSASQRYLKKSEKIAEEAKAFLGTLSFNLAVRGYDKKAGDWFLLLTLKNNFDYFFYSENSKKDYEKKTFRELEKKLSDDAPKKAATESTYEIHLPAYVLAFDLLSYTKGDVGKALQKAIDDDPEDLYRTIRKKKASAKELYDKGLSALNKRLDSSLKVYSTSELVNIINEVSFIEMLTDNLCEHYATSNLIDFFSKFF